MIVEVPLVAAVGIAAVLAAVVLILGAALYRRRVKPNTNVEGGPDVPNLIQGSQSIVTAPIQPAKKSLLTKIGIKKDTQPDFEEHPREYLGKINFSMSFEKETGTMSVHILEAVDLKAMDISGTSDPYVKVSLLPERKDIKVTKIHRRNLCPKFSQTLHFPGHSSKRLNDMTLCIQVMDHDRFSRDDPIGEVLLPMKNVKLDNAPVYWKHLQKPTIHKEYKGEVMLSLCYLPQSNKLTAVVIKAKDLPHKDIIGTADPYIKLWLIQSGSKLEKRKTTVKSQTLAPVFNESFAFSLPPPDKLDEEVQLVITVMDYDLLSSNDEIGHCVVGSRGGETGAKHWREVIEHPEHPCAMWHKLSPKW
jgi:hypothetical protein